MDLTEVGKKGLVGWREKVGDGIAGPLAQRAPVSDEQVRAAVGAVFFALSLYYVIGTVKRTVEEVKDR